MTREAARARRLRARAYTTALGLVEQLSARQPLDELRAQVHATLLAGLVAAERARSTDEDTQPPTHRQRRLLRCLGHRGPTPQDQAGVRAIVAELGGKDGAGPGAGAAVPAEVPQGERV